MPTTLVMKMTAMETSLSWAAAWPSRQASVRAESETHAAIEVKSSGYNSLESLMSERERECVCMCVGFVLWTCSLPGKKRRENGRGRGLSGVESTGGEKSLFSGLNCVGQREKLFVRIHKLIHSDVEYNYRLILPITQ